jgi:hypothetical protein
MKGLVFLVHSVTGLVNQTVWLIPLFSCSQIVEDLQLSTPEIR